MWNNNNSLIAVRATTDSNITPVPGSNNDDNNNNVHMPLTSTFRLYFFFAYTPILGTVHFELVTAAAYSSDTPSLAL